MCPPSSGSSGSMLNRNSERLKPATRKSIVATRWVRRDVEVEDLAADAGRADHAHRGVRLARRRRRRPRPTGRGPWRAGRPATATPFGHHVAHAVHGLAEGLLDDAGGRGEAEEAGRHVLALDVAAAAVGLGDLVRDEVGVQGLAGAVPLDGDRGRAGGLADVLLEVAPVRRRGCR